LNKKQLLERIKDLEYDLADCRADLEKLTMEILDEDDE